MKNLAIFVVGVSLVALSSGCCRSRCNPCGPCAMGPGGGGTYGMYGAAPATFSSAQIEYPAGAPTVATAPGTYAAYPATASAPAAYPSYPVTALAPTESLATY